MIFSQHKAVRTECAINIVIIYYKVVLDLYGDNLFNTAFRNHTDELAADR